VKLTQEDVEVMTKVRENMRRRYDEGKELSAPYICWNIIEAIVGRNTMFDGPGLDTQLLEMGGQAARLHGMIRWALRDCGTMGTYISEETWHISPAFSWYASRFEAEARLAWLDRMIEMKEIK
jgi:hypothetical protein